MAIAVSLPSTTRDVLLRGLDDERRHFQWIPGHAGDLLTLAGRPLFPRREVGSSYFVSFI
jgi:hypothetical protein